MSEDINKKAFKEAEKELLKKKIEQVKGYILETLESIEEKKKAKAKTEEELRVLKLDLEDLRQGKFDKIKERRAKSELAKEVSVDLSFTNEYNSLNVDGGSNGSKDLASDNICVSCLNVSDNMGDEAWKISTAGTYPLKDGKSVYF